MKLFIIVISLVIAAACGSTGGGDRTSDTSAKGVNSTESNTAVAADNPASGSANTTVIRPVEATNYKVGKANSSIANDPSAKPPAPTAMPAPDDSLVTTVMGRDGLPVETRVFKSDPQLSKVVRTWFSTKEKKITVYLKNGKTVEMDGDKFENISTVPATAILEAAGLKPQSGKDSVPGAKH